MTEGVALPWNIYVTLWTGCLALAEESYRYLLPHLMFAWRFRVHMRMLSAFESLLLLIPSQERIYNDNEACSVSSATPPSKPLIVGLRAVCRGVIGGSA